MNLNLLLLLLLSISLSSSFLNSSEAETPPLAHQFQCSSALELPAAKSILSKVQSTYTGVDQLKAAFKQESYLAALDQSEQSSGDVWFEKPSRMRWNYTVPEQQAILIKDSTFWFYQSRENQIVIDNFSKVIISDLPISFLLGIGNLLSDFTLRKSCRSSAGILFELVPKTQQESLQSFTLITDEKSALPKGAEVTDIGGNITRILLSQLSVNKISNSASLFMPDFPKGADIIDRRDNKV